MRPSLLVEKTPRRRHQDPIPTRIVGRGRFGPQPRSLMDGVLISSPIAEQQQRPAPHFGVVAPQDVSRIDVL